MTTETTIKERPIRLYPHEVRGILEGRQTQTRRVIKNPRGCSGIDQCGYAAFTPEGHVSVRGTFIEQPQGEMRYGEWFVGCPYGQPGDRLWGKETWATLHDGSRAGKTNAYLYRADELPEFADIVERWRPSIHMPRHASRILLEITDVRVERLQDISEVDAEAEGVELLSNGFYRDYGFKWEAGVKDGAVESFQTLWQSINGPDSWSENPWVWAIEFKRIEPCP